MGARPCLLRGRGARRAIAELYDCTVSDDATRVAYIPRGKSVRRYFLPNALPIRPSALPSVSTSQTKRLDLRLSSRQASRRRSANCRSARTRFPRRCSSRHVLPSGGDIRSIDLHRVSTDSSRRRAEKPILSTELPILPDALQVLSCRLRGGSVARLGLSVAHSSVSDDLPILSEGHPRLPNAPSGAATGVERVLDELPGTAAAPKSGSLELARYFKRTSTDCLPLLCLSFVTGRIWKAKVVAGVRRSSVVVALSVGGNAVHLV